MTYVLRMSTDADIVNTQLNAAWNPIAANYQWHQINPPAGLYPPGVGIPNGATIVVIAHGASAEIGNAKPGVVDIGAELFLYLIHANTAANGRPARIYISACAPYGIEQFTTLVRLTAEHNLIWAHSRIFSHTARVAGPVPAPDSPMWQPVF